MKKGIEEKIQSQKHQYHSHILFILSILKSTAIKIGTIIFTRFLCRSDKKKNVINTIHIRYSRN